MLHNLFTHCSLLTFYRKVRKINNRMSDNMASKILEKKKRKKKKEKKKQEDKKNR